MIRFKVGDRVRVIRTNDCVRNDYIGRILTIREINPNGNGFGDHYGFSEPDIYWVFYDEELELARFTKEDLKDGMVVETRELHNNRYLVAAGRLVQDGDWLSLDAYTDDLKDSANNLSKFNIDKIYEPFNLCCIKDIFKDSYLKLIWERKNEEIHKEMTVEEIEKELGYKIKVVGRGD